MADSALRTLALRLGILAEYVDQTGRETRSTTDETRVAIIAAMGFDATTEERATAALATLDARDHARTLAPVRVIVHDSAFTLPSRAAEVTLERGGTWHEGAELPIGYHTLTLAGATQSLIVVPPHCAPPVRRAMGVIANLYAVRSERGWGVGDITDLAAVAADKKPSPLNEFSGPGYRVINFVGDLPVRIDKYLCRLPDDPIFAEYGTIVFVLTEFQIIDVRTAEENERGENSHDKYKDRQAARVKARLMHGMKDDGMD